MRNSRTGTLALLAFAAIPALVASRSHPIARGAVRSPVEAADDCSSGTRLCFADGRFRVEVSWTAPDGSSRSAHAVALTSEAGYFWFFDPDNVELAVKVLNGCGINARYWAFATGLTNLEVTITVTDTVTGQVKTYSNPQARAFPPILDTDALDACSNSAMTEMAGRNPEEPGSFSDERLARDAPAASHDVRCGETGTTLCLGGNRFKVEATWQTASGASGSGQAVLLTENSGYFWFFEPSNVELIVKRLDACAIGGGQWFFAAGMTDVFVTIIVTDTFTGQTRTYSNVLGTPFVPIQDAAAFSFCPTPTPTPPPGNPATHTAFITTGKATVCKQTCQGRCLEPGCTVLVDSFFFNPDPIHVRAGDTVVWTWSGTHSVTATGGSVDAFDSGIKDGGSFRHTFPHPGTFEYTCQANHRHAGGSVIVDP